MFSIILEFLANSEENTIKYCQKSLKSIIFKNYVSCKERNYKILEDAMKNSKLKVEDLINTI